MGTCVSINNVCARIFLFSLIVVAAGAEEADEAGASNDTRSCCDSLILESGGMGDYYQGSRLGKFILSGISSQQGGDNYLFFLPGPSVWMVGPTVGQDFGGGLNRDWEYYMDWMDSWEEDWTLEARCEGDPGPTPDPESDPCTWGSYCDGCDHWAEADGVKYCCATDCNNGDVEVSTSNGDVTCRCYHH